MKLPVTRTTREETQDILRLPFQKSSFNSERQHLHSYSYNSESNAENDVAATNLKKRKINAISEKAIHFARSKRSMFRIQNLQRPSKERHLQGVFSEAVDPNELRNYHEVIEVPMDFGSVRKKLARGAYGKLKQFEVCWPVILYAYDALDTMPEMLFFFRQDNLSLALASCNSKPYFGWLAEHKFERNNEFTGSSLKGNWLKNGKKQVVFDGNRVGLLSEYGHSRILARFAANLKTVTWKVASKKIEQSLPAGINFGPGWVGENVASPRPLAIPNPAPAQVSPSQLFSRPGNSCKVSSMEMAGDKSLEDTEREDTHEKHMPTTHSDSDSHPSKPLLSSPLMSSNPIFANKSPEAISKRPEPSSGEIRPGPPFQNPVILHRMKGVYGFNFPAQMGKLIGSTMPSGINFQTFWNDNMISRVNNSAVHPTTANGLTA
ncbi:Bromodomain and PHD finger-containing protein [Actinidia chinensis var. chinensis]|uniref:Bromodomain and PHD finger-containing protein n=1 Tax=Actinidia chinensis var. chinensis TaxID=1590841 RepID=A0A2R6R719_ACTCC|nr:Bromodomain and PHD finger-containing protein [Actinidia chinensis var. chinensis]